MQSCLLRRASATLVRVPQHPDVGSVCVCRCYPFYPDPSDRKCPSMTRSSVWVRTSQATQTLQGFRKAWLRSATTNAPGKALPATPPANPALLLVRRQSNQGSGQGWGWALLDKSVRFDNSGMAGNGAQMAPTSATEAHLF